MEVVHQVVVHPVVVVVVDTKIYKNDLLPKDVYKNKRYNQPKNRIGSKESYVFDINNRWDYSHNSINVIDKRIEDDLEYLKVEFGKINNILYLYTRTYR